MIHPPVVLGLDFGGTKIAAAVCDLAGNKLASVAVPSRGELGAVASFAHGIETARDLLRSAAPDSRLAAIGAATFGIPFEDRVELAPAIKGWGSLRFGDELRTAFPGVRVRMATDAKAAARAESRWGALAGYDPAVYLNLGTGLATAIVIGGRVLAGGHGAAGEIGYNLRTPEDVGRELGHRVMLEAMVSGQALPGRAAAAGLSPDGQSAADVFLASRRDPKLDGLIGEFVNELAFHLTNLAIIVDPVRIAVGGGMARSWDRIGPRLTQALQAGVPFPPELVVAHFPEDAPLLGAVALAVDAAASAGDGGAGGWTGSPGGAGNARDGAPGDQTLPEVDGSEKKQEQDGQSWTHAGADGASAVSSTEQSLPLA
jgi:glucokinase